VAQSVHCEEGENECFMGFAEWISVISRGFQSKEPHPQIFTPQLAIIRRFEGDAAKVLWTATGQQGYRFDNASMTESCRVEMGPLPLLALWAWGKEPN
jgi:hypothetical protein